MKKAKGWMGGILDMGDGRFQIKLYGNYDNRGRQYRKLLTIEATSYKEAKELRDQLTVDFRKSVRKPDGHNLLFSECAQDFLDNECLHNRQLSHDTMKNYRDKFDSYLNPFFGKMRIRDIEALDINSFLAWMRKPEQRTRRTKKDQPKKTPLSDTTVVHAFALLKNLFHHVHGLYISENPMLCVRSPKMPEHKVPDFSNTLLSDILNGLAEENSFHYALAVIVAIGSGCRRGEFLGADWSDLDWGNCTINIHKTDITRTAGA